MTSYDQNQKSKLIAHTQTFFCSDVMNIYAKFTICDYQRRQHVLCLDFNRNAHWNEPSSFYL